METKICIKCKEEKSVDCFRLRKDTGNYAGECKECRGKYWKQYSKKNRAKINARLTKHFETRKIESKVCSKCGEEKPIEAFNKRRSRCRICEKENSPNYYSKNKDKSKAYRIKHAERIKENRKVYCKNNRDKINETAKLWAADNIERLRKERAEYNKNRKKTHPIFALSCSIRNSLLKWLKRASFRKENRTQEIVGCSWEFLHNHLGEKFKNSQIDHILPLEKFEEIIPESVFVKLLWNYRNLQRLPKELNRRKWYYLPTDWIERLQCLEKELNIDVSEIILKLQKNITPYELFWDNTKRTLVPLKNKSREFEFLPVCRFTNQEAIARH